MSQNPNNPFRKIPAEETNPFRRNLQTTAASSRNPSVPARPSSVAPQAEIIYSCRFNCGTTGTETWLNNVHHPTCGLNPSASSAAGGSQPSYGNPQAYGANIQRSATAFQAYRARKWTGPAAPVIGVPMYTARGPNAEHPSNYLPTGAPQFTSREARDRYNQQQAQMLEQRRAAEAAAAAEQRRKEQERQAYAKAQEKLAAQQEELSRQSQQAATYQQQLEQYNQRVRELESQNRILSQRAPTAAERVERDLAAARRASKQPATVNATIAPTPPGGPPARPVAGPSRMTAEQWRQLTSRGGVPGAAATIPSSLSRQTAAVNTHLTSSLRAAQEEHHGRAVDPKRKGKGPANTEQ